MHRVVIIGTGGLAREFTSFFSQQCEVAGYCSTVHSEHAEFGLAGRFFADEVTPEMAQTDQAVVAIGIPAAKAVYYEKLRAVGFAFPSFVHTTSVVSEKAQLGEGVVVSPGCVVSPGVVIGALCYLNFSCGLGHDVVVGNFVQVNPGAQIGGWTRIGHRSLVGSGSVVLDRVTVGAGATVASGAVVFAPVADGATVMGNPARRMRALERTETTPAPAAPGSSPVDDATPY